MGKVGAGFSMSLDGFISGPNDDEERLFRWYFTGDTTVKISSGDTEYEFSTDSGTRLQDVARATGAIVSGRRMFDLARAWGGKHPMAVPVFVVTHTVPQEWVREGSPFTFVTDGVESAIAQAQAVAGEKAIGVGGADIMQQCLKAGLLDEIHIDLVPVLLGDGVRLFQRLGIEPVELESTEVSQSSGVTHLTFRVLK